MSVYSISHKDLMQQLTIANIRKLENLLIAERSHQGIVTGSLIVAAPPVAF